MNLIEKDWIPVVRSSGKPDRIAPWQIAEKKDPVKEITAPRPDFQGALYQFIIGLLQTCFAPEDHEEWIEHWEEMPDWKRLKDDFSNISAAFDLDNPEGPAFMQDYIGYDGLFSIIEQSGKKPKRDEDCLIPIRNLLIDAPMVNTIKENRDLFTKRGEITSLCRACSAIALFTLQTNAPAGGSGQRVGLRGGGPLTTIVVPSNNDSTLWHKLWLNVLDREAFAGYYSAFRDNLGKLAYAYKDLENEIRDLVVCLEGNDGSDVILENSSHLLKRTEGLYKETDDACLERAKKILIDIKKVAEEIATVECGGEKYDKYHKRLRDNAKKLDKELKAVEKNHEKIEKVLPDIHQCKIDQKGRLLIAEKNIFPWMGKTRVSDKKNSDTRPDQVHPMQMFWGMPRRIRIKFDTSVNGRCDICGDAEVNLVREYITQKDGVDYQGAWAHPLTPYHFHVDKEEIPISLKGKKGRVGYHHWPRVAASVNTSVGNQSAQVTRAYINQRSWYIGADRTCRLWCFGYDMDRGKAKARCWYDHTLPLFCLERAQRENLLAWAGELIGAAEYVAANLRGKVKDAWFRHPKNVKGDMSMVSQSFWQLSETDFYQILANLTHLPGDQGQAPTKIYGRWLKIIRRLAFRIFDEWVLKAPGEDMDMKRIISAREDLRKKLNTAKVMKQLMAKAEP